LRWFCKQHSEKLIELSAIRGGINDTRADGQPHARKYGNPTADRAEKALRLGRDVEALKQAAIEASAELYQYIIRNVTMGIRYVDVGAPAGKNQFSLGAVR